MKDKIKEVLDQWDLSCSEEADIKDELATQIAKALEPKYHDVEEFYQDDPYSYWPCCDVQGCDQVSCSGGGCWKDTGYWSVCPDHSQMFRDGILPQPVMKESSIRREMTRDEDGCLPVEQPETKCTICANKDDSMKCASCREKIIGGEDWFMEIEPEPKEGVKCNCDFVMIQRDHETQKAYCFECKKEIDESEIIEPEGARQWQNLLALDMADFYLEIYASRDTFSRAKIMEMFRDYHIHKLSNIKKKITDKIELFENAIKASNELESNQIERYEAIIRNMNHLLD